ncbi:hypothetical protein E1178_18355 [Roseibium hamelinense]|nr:hypothetical protein [Roseibium hamelinense]
MTPGAARTMPDGAARTMPDGAARTMPDGAARTNEPGTGACPPAGAGVIPRFLSSLSTSSELIEKSSSADTGILKKRPSEV